MRDARKALDFLWNIDAHSAVRRALLQARPDVVHLHNIYHHLSSSVLEPIRNARIPCVQTLHDYKLACPNYQMFTHGALCERCRGGQYWNAIAHRCLGESIAKSALAMAEMTMTSMARVYHRTVHRFIAPSGFLLETMVHWGIDRAQLSLLRNPTDIASGPALGGGGYLLFAGRLVATKGIETILRAVARVSTFPLWICGTGPEEPRLRRLAADLAPGRIRFLGFLRPAELQAVRAQSEAVIVPSLHYENCPLSLLEALGSGIPVLASEIGGIPELIKDGVEGFLVPAGSEAAWTKALLRFTALPDASRTAMRRAGIDRARQAHAWDDHLDGLDELYRLSRTGTHAPHAWRQKT